MRAALLTILALGAFAPATTAHAADAPKIVVVLKAGTADGPIAPYEEAARGFKEMLQPVAEVLIAPGITDHAVESVKAEDPDLLVAFGTEAARFAETSFPEIPRVVALAPGVSVTPGATCAMITPDVGADVQVRWIDESLPDVRAVGVLYDPSASQNRIDELVAEAARRRADGAPLTIVPIPVSSAAEVPDAFKSALPRIEALLFVPDRTVITRGTISYVLREMLAASKPVIGFNWYFVDNGAVLAFGLDYDAIGRQAARAARRLPEDGDGWVEGPTKVNIWINRRVADKLRIRTDYDPDKVTEIR